MGKSLLSTCRICSTSVQNGSQQIAKEATTVNDILINNTNLKYREEFTLRNLRGKNSVFYILKNIRHLGLKT